MEENNSMLDIYNKRLNDSTQATKQSKNTLSGAKAKFEQYHNDYVTGKRNPVADIITKPQRDADREKRLKDVAKWSVIGEAIGLLGKGWAASKGVKPLPTEGATTFRALGKLEELDQLYRQEGYRYDQARLSDALRRQQASDIVEQYKLSAAEQDHNQNQQRLDNAQNNLDAFIIRKDEINRQDRLIKDEREHQDRVRKESYDYQDKANARDLNNQMTLMNYRAQSNSNHSQNSDTLYHIKNAKGEIIPVNSILETQIVAEAMRQGLIKDYENWAKGDIKNSPQGRVQIQNLFQQLDVDGQQAQINQTPQGAIQKVIQTSNDIATKYPDVKLESKSVDFNVIAKKLAKEGSATVDLTELLKYEQFKLFDDYISSYMNNVGSTDMNELVSIIQESNNDYNDVDKELGISDFKQKFTNLKNIFRNNGVELTFNGK